MQGTCETKKLRAPYNSCKDSLEKYLIQILRYIPDTTKAYAFMEKENPFKKLGKPAKEVPKGLKRKVMSMIKLSDRLTNATKDTDMGEDTDFLFTDIEKNSAKKE